MVDVIAPLPALPEQLRIAAKLGNLVPFIGAGLSKLAGCPDWGEFSQLALRVFVDNGNLNFSQLEQIKSLSPRIQLSLAVSLQNQHRKSIDFAKLLEPRSGASRDQGVRAYGSLGKLANVFVTTNYDEWLDTVSGGSIIPTEKGNGENATSTIRRNVISRVEDIYFSQLSVPDDLPPGFRTND